VQRPREPILSSPVVARAARVAVVAWSAVGMAILAYLILRYVLYPIRIVFPPILVAAVVVYLLEPVVSRLSRRGLRRGLATLVTYVAFLAALGALLFWLVPLISHQVVEYGHSIPALLRRAQHGLVAFAHKLGLDVRRANLLGAFGKGGSIGEYVGRVRSLSSAAVGLALILVLGPVLAFYLLVDLPKIRRGLEAAIPPRRRPEVQAVVRRVSGAVGGYFRGQLLVAAFVGAASMLGLWIIGLPYWAPVGLLVGLFSLIPLIGPFLGAIPTLFIAFTTPTAGPGVLLHLRPGWPLAVAASVVLLLVQQVDAHLISPRLVSRMTRLHPLSVMLSLLVAGTVAGVWGMLLAIPAVAAVKILVVHYWDTRMVWPPGPAEDRAEPPPPEDAAEPAPATVAPLPDEDGEPSRWSPSRLARAWRQGRTPAGRTPRSRS
jgi:predicted PurR-regulated permease PerM